MSGTQTHFERMTGNHLMRNRPRARKLIAQVVEDGVNEVWRVLPLVMGHAVDEHGSPLKPWPGATEYDLAAVQFELVCRLLGQQDDPYSYSQMMTGPDFYSLVNYLIQALPMSMVHVSMQLGYQMASHDRCGKRVYDVTPDLAAQLAATELRGLKADDLRLPYESIYIQIPKEAGLKVWNADTGWHRAIGAYITEERHMSETDEYRRGGKTGDIRGWRIMLVGQDKAQTTQMAGDDALSFFRVVLEDGKSLDEILAQAYREMEWDLKNNPHTSWDDRMSHDWEQQFRWLMNVVLYATWEEPGEHWDSNPAARKLWTRIQKQPAKSKKRTALNRKLQTIDRQRRIRLGSRIVIDRKRAANPDNGEKSGNESRHCESLRVKTRVSGHWRRVACGKKRMERRLKWIEPFWRNLDGLTPSRSPTRELR